MQTPREAPEYIDAATQRQIGNNLELARQLGGTPLPFKGTDLISTIATFVKEYGITHVVLGRTRQAVVSPLLSPLGLGTSVASCPRC